jgi:hypothetical protein
MSADRFPDAFAQAERLAKWAHVVLGVEGVELFDILYAWRTNNDVPLSMDALSVVVAHVAVGTGAQHIANARGRAA